MPSDGGTGGTGNGGSSSGRGDGGRGSGEGSGRGGSGGSSGGGLNASGTQAGRGIGGLAGTGLGSGNTSSGANSNSGGGLNAGGSTAGRNSGGLGGTGLGSGNKSGVGTSPGSTGGLTAPGTNPLGAGVGASIGLGGTDTGTGGFTAGEIGEALSDKSLSPLGQFNKNLVGTFGISPEQAPSLATVKTVLGILGLLGLPGAALSAVADYGLTKKPSDIGGLVGLAVGAATKSNVLGQAANLGTKTAMGDSVGWGGWGALGSSALGFGPQIGQVVGNFAETGTTPSAQDAVGWATTFAAQQLGINPNVARAAVNAAMAGGVTGPASSGRGDGGGGFGGNVGLGVTTSGGDAAGFTPEEFEAPIFGGGTSTPIFGGVGLDQGGQGSGVVLPDSFALGQQSTPLGRQPGRTISRDGGGEKASTTSKASGPGTVLARTLGGGRRGF